MIINSKMPLATKVDGCVGDAKIAEMWKCHYKSLLNSVQSGNFKISVMLDVNKQIKNSITITPFDILDALSMVNLVVLMEFPENTLFLLIVVYMFYYHCYSQLSLLMVTCPVCF